MRTSFILGEVWTGLQRNASMAVSVALVTMVSLFFLGVGMLSYRQVDTMKGYWYDKIQVSIVLCNDSSTAATCAKGAATEKDRTTIEAQLRAMPIVEEVYYESQQEAYERFKEQFRNNPIVENTRPEQLKASYRVKLTDPSKYVLLTSSFQGAPGVEKVEDQRKVVEPLIDLLHRLSVWTIVLASVMLVCSVLLVATTIRQTAYSRRRETGIMRLVGASAMTIQLPFVLETLLAALTGAALATGLLWGVLHYFVERQIGSMLILGGVAVVGPGDLWDIVPWLFGAAALIALVTSWVSLRRYLRV